ncbi:hypothetical protein AgCh_023815 [Apium graveolens]
MVYLGKEPGTKGSRLFNPEMGRVHNMSVPTSDGATETTGASSATSTEPRRFRMLDDIYDSTEVVDQIDELMLLKAEKAMSFREAAESRSNGKMQWRLKWVYKLKRDPEGNVVKYKARLVAKGYVQRKEVDYDEVFAPVARLDTVRLLLALSAKEECKVHHLDIKLVFLNGELLEEVYVTQPEGFVKKGQEQMVYRLVKALYGLRQAPRAWNAKLDKCLRELGFEKCLHEQAVYTRCRNGKILVVRVYVDDLLVAGAEKQEIEAFKQDMNKHFEMSNLGLLSFYLGIEVNQEGKCTTLK